MSDVSWLDASKFRPELFVRVLVCVRRTTASKAVVIGFIDAQGDWQLDNCRGSEVTHWTELPEMPQ